MKRIKDIKVANTLSELQLILSRMATVANVDETYTLCGASDSVTITLIEETLTDGSKVHDVEFS